jgi:hypothetical protein
VVRALQHEPAVVHEVEQQHELHRELRFLIVSYNPNLLNFKESSRACLHVFVVCAPKQFII